MFLIYSIIKRGKCVIVNYNTINFKQNMNLNFEPFNVPYQKEAAFKNINGLTNLLILCTTELLSFSTKALRRTE